MHFATVFSKQLLVAQFKHALVKEEVYYLKINSGSPFHYTLGRHFTRKKSVKLLRGRPTTSVAISPFRSPEKKRKTSEGKANNS